MLTKRPDKNKAYGPDQKRAYVSPASRDRARQHALAEKERRDKAKAEEQARTLQERGAVFVRDGSRLIGKIERCEITGSLRAMCYVPSVGTICDTIAEASAWIRKKHGAL